MADWRVATVDGTLIEAWTSQKSFKPQAGGEAEPPAEGRNREVIIRREKRCDDTHQSTTDPEARPYKKAKGNRRSWVISAVC